MRGLRCTHQVCGIQYWIILNGVRMRDVLSQTMMIVVEYVKGGVILYILVGMNPPYSHLPFTVGILYCA